MISSIDKSGDQFLFNLDRLQQQFARTESQLSSGKRVTTAADAPDQVVQLLTLRSEYSLNTQRQKNLQVLQTDTDAADRGLTSALQLIDQALSLGTQGASSFSNASSRATLAQQVQAVQQQIVGIANTESNGRYIFSGDGDQAQSYAVNLSAPNGVTQLQPLPNTRLSDNGSGTLSPSTLTAQDIFDHRNANGTFASDNVFSALTALSTALNSNNDAGITAAISSLREASTYVNTQQGFYASLQQQLASATNALSQKLTDVQTNIAGIEDADPTQAAIDLAQEQTSLQAAYASRAKAPHNSLFDFLG